MAIWIQSLSWALIYSLAQGIAVYASLWLLLRAMPAGAANARYHLSLSALTVMLGWFVATWWQQFHSLTLANEQLLAANATGTTVLWLPLQQSSVVDAVYNLRSSLTAFLPWLSAFYVVGLMLMLARLSAGMFQLFSLRTSGIFQPDAALTELLVAQKRKIQLAGPVKLLISAKAQVPMVIGFFKPVILMPVAAIAQLDAEQLEAILLHELAHIKRHDYLVNILQTIVETILFFNPFVWAISTIVRREREHSCDDLVVNHTAEPISYATALATLASTRPAVPLIAVAATGQSTYLFTRIKRIMEMKKNTFSYSRMVATIIIIVAISGSIAWAKPTFTKAKKNRNTAAATPTPEGTHVANTGDIIDEKDRQIVNYSTRKPIEPQPKFTDISEIKKDKPGTTTAIPEPAETQTANANLSEESILVGRLLEDKMVDQVKGFVVEKKQNTLYINGLLLQDADKYLLNLKKDLIRVQVFSMEQRMRMHPEAGFIQLLLPATFSSPCMDTRPVKKEGC